MSQKRSFPYHSDVPEVQLKRQYIGSHPGIDQQQPKILVDPSQQTLDTPAENELRGVTDFSCWSEHEIKQFLEIRGEDYCDCKSQQELVARAQMCEINTGPAAAVGVREKEEGGEDPLDAFMAEMSQMETGQEETKTVDKHAIACDEEIDQVADYMEARKKQHTSGGNAVTKTLQRDGWDSDDEVYKVAEAISKGTEIEYDEEDNVIVTKKNVEPLPSVDHSLIEYEDFAKDFYEEHEEIKAMTTTEVVTYRGRLHIKAVGINVAKPIKQFQHCGFDKQLMGALTKAEYKEPTPIQAQALPVILSGNDVIGIAQTGSGKTAAFVLPMIVHIMDQPLLQKGQGPIGVIIAPTRELSEQIHKECRRFSKPYNLSVCAAFGGLRKYDQVKQMKQGVEIAVCTPGRIIDLVKGNACSLEYVTYLVLDEADRMFDMGFEPQVRSIMGQVRPDRQTLMFSATMPKKVEQLAIDVLSNPVRIIIGEQGVANIDVLQKVEVFDNDTQKMGWLLGHLASFVDQGEVLIFVNQKVKVESLVTTLIGNSYKTVGLHGDMDQHTRMEVLHKFKEGIHHILVATDVASRGLDIKSIKTVINFDVAQNIETHIHRVGRTGRAGDKEGVAHTLLTQKDIFMAGKLVSSLSSTGQDVSENLHKLAMKDNKYKKKMCKAKGGQRNQKRKVRFGGAGLGYEQGPTEKNNQKIHTIGFVPSSKSYSQQNVALENTVASARLERDRPFLVSQFVSAGTHKGDIHQAPTILAPKKARAQAGQTAPTPVQTPTPVTQKPLYAEPLRTSGWRKNMQQSTSMDSEEKQNVSQKAAETARAIAERLMQQQQQQN